MADPRILPFTIPSRGLRLREITGEATLEAAATIHLGGEYLESILQFDRRTNACRTPEKIDEQWDRHRKENPTARRDQFKPVLDDSDCRNVRQFEIRRAGKVWGTWFLYNVVELLSTRTRLAVRALMVPGIPWEGRLEAWIEDMLELMDAFLSERELDDGRTFLLRDFDFATDKPGHRWSQASNNIYAAAMQDVIIPRLLARGFEKTDRVVDGVATPKMIRRRPDPPPR